MRSLAAGLPCCVVTTTFCAALAAGWLAALLLLLCPHHPECMQHSPSKVAESSPLHAAAGTARSWLLLSGKLLLRSRWPGEATLQQAMSLLGPRT